MKTVSNSTKIKSLARAVFTTFFLSASVDASLDYRYFVAGGVCAATSHGITTPVDVVKTRMQADLEKYNQGIRQAALDIMKEDGPQALLGGLGPTVLGYGVEGAMKFGVYEVMKPITKRLLEQISDTDHTAIAYIAASVIAGAVASILLCPMESARIKMVTDTSYSQSSLLQVLNKISQENGVLSLFGGIWAMLTKQIPYTMAKQVSFDVVAGMLYALFDSKKDLMSTITANDIKWIVSVTAAFVASIFACIFSQPGDMILTETYKGSSGEKRPFLGVVQNIYGKGGIPGFFTGVGARILHVGMIITSQLVIYDIVKQLLGLPATGSH
jgi:solute carrier family 25 phosphate transporter 3